MKKKKKNGKGCAMKGRMGVVDVFLFNNQPHSISMKTTAGKNHS